MGAAYRPKAKATVVTATPSQIAGRSSVRVQTPLARQAISSLSWLKRPYTMVAANRAANGSVRDDISGST